MKQTTTDTDERRYAQFGLAALIPGIQHAVDTLQQMLDSARAQLSFYQGLPVVPDQAKAAKPKKKLYRGWPDDPEARKAEGLRRLAVAKKNAKKKTKLAEKKTGWPDDPEARSREMMRRRAVAKKNAKVKNNPGFTKRGRPLKMHPRDPSHPKHAEWVEMMQKALKKGQRKREREEKLLPKVVMDKGVAA